MSIKKGFLKDNNNNIIYPHTEWDLLSNKPTIPSVSVNATGTSTDEVSYITINGTEKKLAGSSYIAGTGINIADNTISVDSTVATSTALTAETNARTAADTTLTNNLNTEISTRENADNVLSTAIGTKQDTLVSGTNIKTINGATLLGSGDMTITAGVSDAQVNGTSVVTSGIANIVTNTAYNASSNKIATMSDLPSGDVDIVLTSTSISDGTTTFNKYDDTALSARVSNIENRGRFLSVWNSTNGQPNDLPGGGSSVTTEYTYKTGDYFLVGTGGGVKMPSGTSIPVGTTIATFPSADGSVTLKVNDTIIFNGSTWSTIQTTVQEVTFSSIAGNATDNTSLATALSTETNARTVADTTLTNNLNSEIARAENAEGVLETAINSKQNTLTAGTNITISGSTISATDTTYTAGMGIDITSNEISVNASEISYNDLADLPTIPTKTSDLTNDSSFITNSTAQISESQVTNLTTDLAAKQDAISDLSTIRSGAALGTTSIQPNDNISELTNDAGYLTSHQSLSAYRTSAAQDVIDAGKQATLVSGTNIKTINSTSVLGSGDITVQPTLVSGTNIKTINGTSVLGSGDISITAGVSDSQINGTSIVTSGVSNFVTNSAYNASTNKIATMSDLPTGEVDLTLTSTSISDGTTTLSIAGKQDTLTAGTNISISGTTISATDTTYTAGTNIQISGTTISATDTTYTSKTAASGGTDVSLVTTGEKYTWNSKQNALTPIKPLYVDTGELRLDIGNGLQIVDELLEAKPGTGITIDATGINVDTTVIQSKLSTAQQNAVDSGITSSKVSTYDGYSGQISTKAPLRNQSVATAPSTFTLTAGNFAWLKNVTAVTLTCTEASGYIVEYKGRFDSAGGTVTFPSGTYLYTNDDDATISSNVFTVPTRTSNYIYEFSLLAGECFVYKLRQGTLGE